MTANIVSIEQESRSILEETFSGDLVLPIDVDQVARRLNINVINDPTLHADGVIGKICFKNDQATVRLNPKENTYEPRRRFTLAHEIGHFVLHRNDKEGFVDSRKTMSRSASYWDAYESEANRFAATLLMPEDLVFKKTLYVLKKQKETIGEIDKERFISRMARIFDVSRLSMEYRLRRLGIIR